MTFDVDAAHPLVTSWPTSFGREWTVLLRTQPRSATPSDVLLVPADVSLADVLTDEDWEAILSRWQGARAKELILENERLRGVKTSMTALIPGVLR
jgi:hypothetical protein